MQTALLGEVITTFTMVLLLIIFIGFRQIRQFTPYMFPVLYAIMVPLEADISGISTNPARSLGPAVISGQWDGFWIYMSVRLQAPCWQVLPAARLQSG